MKVPVLDLKAQYALLEGEVDAALKRVCSSGQFALGPEVERFEQEWAAYCEAAHCVALSNGTDALHLVLLALGVGAGDEVITTPLSFFATAEAILYVGARPVFADVEAGTACLDPGSVEALITERTRALMPVHLYGHPADMDRLLGLARAQELAVIEDACQAHGALYKGRKVGALGTAGAFSFYPTKNLGAYGDAGALVTNDSDLAARVRMLRNHGQNGPYRHAMVGWNCRMDGFQGAVLNVKLKHLDRWNARRREIAERYTHGLSRAPLALPREAPYARSAWHQYVVRGEQRDALQEHLSKAGVATAIHYPVPMPRLEAMRVRHTEGGQAYGLDETPIPQAEVWAERALSLPIYAEMTDEQVDYVVECVRGFFTGRAGASQREAGRA